MTQILLGKIGVIVARFQVSKLHEGHLHLIKYVPARHQSVLVVLGVHGGVRTKENPLTFAEREYMVRETIEHLYAAARHHSLAVLPLNDNPISHRFWCRDLDALIREKFPDREAVLYGSRNSFLAQYRQYQDRAFSAHEVPPASILDGLQSGRDRWTSVRQTLR
jgi:bifunctional NMN adenylyltransferase/nudix hydrolase